jgi:hypothetical protein
MISLTIIDVHSATLSSLSGPRITIFAHHQATPAATGIALGWDWLDNRVRRGRKKPIDLMRPRHRL